MTANKNQHFVPRCHLRHFTVDGADKMIHAINIARAKVILGAAVRHQCSGPNFYGPDEKLERAIQSLETAYGATMRTLTLSSGKADDRAMFTLARFFLFQHMRTEAAAMHAVEANRAMRDAANLGDALPGLAMRDAVQLACRAFVDTIDVVDDLRGCIIKNVTSLPFVTSDNPAILTNRWRFERPRGPWTTFGLGSAGALLFLPLSPRLLYLAYDADVYSVPHEAGVLTVKSEGDVEAFNRHQVLHCIANLYFHDGSHADRLLAAAVNGALLRTPSRQDVTYARFDTRDRGHDRYVIGDARDGPQHEQALIHSRAVHPNPLRWPSVVVIRKNGSVFTNGTGLRYVRWRRTQEPSSRPFWKERP